MKFQVNYVECMRCKHQWVPRIVEVRMCPACKSYKWDLVPTDKELAILKKNKEKRDAETNSKVRGVQEEV